MPKRFQVIIVGGGPVGHGMAIDLAQRGITCALVERHIEPVEIPKGQNLSNRTVEHFWRWNCEPELREARTMPKGHATGGITCYETLLTDNWHPNGINRQGPIRDYYYAANERLPQYQTEKVLRERASQLPEVTAIYGKVARDVVDTGDGVRVTIADAPKDGRRFYSWSAEDQDSSDAGQGVQTLEADYVIGCDGGHSMVREIMGADRDGRDFDQRMVLAVFRSPELHEALNVYPDCSTYRVLKPSLEGYWQFFGRVDLGEGFFFHAPVPRETDRENFDFDALLAEAVGQPVASELDHIGFWDLRVKVANAYRKGRLLIAGDAAHQHPPYGGFGLNTGLEDAANLGWKLAAVLDGWADEALLDSYGAERRPIIEQTSDRIIAGGIEKDRDWLNACTSAETSEAFEQVWADFGAQITGYVKTYEPHYEGSPIVFGPPGGSTDIAGEHVFTARAGHHLPPRALASGRSVFERLGDGFTLLAFDPDHGLIDALEAAAHELGIPLSVVRDRPDSEAAQDYAATLVLIRPDQHVAWIGTSGDAAEILTKVSGRKAAKRSNDKELATHA